MNPRLLCNTGYDGVLLYLSRTSEHCTVLIIITYQNKMWVIRSSVMFFWLQLDSLKWIQISLYVCSLIQLMFVCKAHCGLSLIASPFVSSGSLTVVCPLPTWKLVGSWLLSVGRPHWSESSQGPWRLPASFCQLMGKEDQRSGMAGTGALLTHRQGREHNLICPFAALRTRTRTIKATATEYNLQVVVVVLNYLSVFTDPPHAGV